MYDVVIELVTMWKQQAPVLADIISFISSPGFLSAILVILWSVTFDLKRKDSYIFSDLTAVLFHVRKRQSFIIRLT